MANPVVTARVPEIMIEALNAASTYTGRSIGDITREALAKWLAELDTDALKKELEIAMAEREKALASLTNLKSSAEVAAIDFPGRRAG